MNTTPEKLLPCPFCGRPAEFLKQQSGVAVECTGSDEGHGGLRQCPGDRLTVYGVNRTEAAEGWNTRAPIVNAPVCKCDIRTKLVGDGCHVCNPSYADAPVGEVGDDLVERLTRQCNALAKVALGNGEGLLRLEFAARKVVDEFWKCQNTEDMDQFDGDLVCELEGAITGGLKRHDPAQFEETLIRCAQILDVTKQEWGEAWTEWDQETRDLITNCLRTSGHLKDASGLVACLKEELRLVISTIDADYKEVNIETVYGGLRRQKERIEQALKQYQESGE